MKLRVLLRLRTGVTGLRRLRDAVQTIIKRYGWRAVHGALDSQLPTLDRCLDDVAAQGYAVERGERRTWSYCVAAPMRDRSRAVVAAMSVSACPPRPARGPHLTLERVAGEVVERASYVSGRLGFLET